jgi:quercetin dioxygenase-like cupin family protein
MIQSLDLLPVSITSHKVGKKKCFDIKNIHEDITQIAVGFLAPFERIDDHKHPSMDEYFYIIEGLGVIDIAGEKSKIKKDDFIYIQANTVHSLVNSSELMELKFFYWGIKKLG